MEQCTDGGDGSRNDRGGSQNGKQRREKFHDEDIFEMISLPDRYRERWKCALEKFVGSEDGEGGLFLYFPPVVV